MVWIKIVVCVLIMCFSNTSQQAYNGYCPEKLNIDAGAKDQFGLHNNYCSFKRTHRGKRSGARVNSSLKNDIVVNPLVQIGISVRVTNRSDTTQNNTFRPRVLKAIDLNNKSKCRKSISNIKLINAHSIKSNASLIQQSLRTETPQIIAITETWMANEQCDYYLKEISPIGHKSFSICRQNKRGGGLAFICHEN